MATYALASIPLIRRIRTDEARQVWFTDNATAGGKLTATKDWWDKLSTSGPSYGYNVNEPKSWLYVKEAKAKEAMRLFANTGVQVTTVGTRHLGSAIGSDEFIKDFVQLKVTKWLT